MRITYDRTVDAAKIYLVEIERGAAVTQKCLSLENGEIILDFDKDGYLLGIEILGADSILKPELRTASELWPLPPAPALPWRVKPPSVRDKIFKIRAAVAVSAAGAGS